ncbi:hypothetical protein [Sphingobacterium faecium]|uniref:hypothetical protein n=1 Tax=Sphingobacterium faecium TaxID=34087 RepID=UPI00247889D7|nr:hypothetical protein [Sphingobacterium faecium]WGQ15603.1 hypothetical protein QG727_04155 [Sphingobacterium faecium]
MKSTKVSVELQYKSVLIISNDVKKYYINHPDSVWRFWQLIKDSCTTLPVLTCTGVAFEANISDELLSVIKKFDGIH